MPVTNPQSGILDSPPEHLLAVALDLVPTDVPSCQSAVRALRELVRDELAADIREIDPDTNPAAPSPDTGELGVATGYDTTNLTITFGLASSGLQKLGVSADQLPVDLIPINWGWFGDQPANANEGDVVLQVCADSSYIVEHVLRRMEHELGASFTVVWTMVAEQRNGASHGEPLTADTARALIGFHDGLSNLNPKSEADQLLIFVGQDGAPPCPPSPEGQQPAPQPGQSGYDPSGGQGPTFPTDLRQPPAQAEPAWTKDGSYLMIRGSVLNLSTWDHQPLQQQEATIGRWKYSGATLDNPNDPAHRNDRPAFVAQPTSVAVPANSHIRRANPRAEASDALRRIFRRGYPLILASAQGTLERGHLFVAYGRTLSSQVEFIMRAWVKNPNFPQPNSGVDPLLALETQVFAGGYYFVPPVTEADQPWNWSIPGL